MCIPAAIHSYNILIHSFNVYFVVLQWCDDDGNDHDGDGGDDYVDDIMTMMIARAVVFSTIDVKQVLKIHLLSQINTRNDKNRE